MIKAESMTSREELYKLVDHIPESDVAAARSESGSGISHEEVLREFGV